jgi:hypothetical protein
VAMQAFNQLANGFRLIAGWFVIGDEFERHFFMRDFCVI